MSKNSEPLRLFVAMPGTDMGASARWKDPEQIKKYFFQKISEQLQKTLRRPVKLVIEKDKVLGGLIHASMFKEAWEADVYIADLTGNNPNVYLELGVRWALKDSITIVVSQDVSSIKFNAAANRAIPYKDDPDTLSKAVEDVVKAITQELAESNYIDSPVRLNAEVVVNSKEDIKQLENRIKQLEEENTLLRLAQGRDYLTAGRSSNDPQYRLSMFRKAIEANPSLIEGYLDLGVELRKLGDYQAAVTILQQGIALDAHSAQFHRELGVVYNKIEQFEKAVHALREAVGLDPQDTEAWNNLGGALRRLGMRKPPDESNWDVLRDARNSYYNAVTLDERDSYALGNVARLDLLLSQIEPERKSYAMDELETLRHLCLIKRKKAPNDYWLCFDLADTYLFVDDANKGHQLYREAVQLIPPDYRVSILASVISPLEEILSMRVVEDQSKAVVQEIVEELKQASHQPSSPSSGT
jgi:tetratricopeptide (TPR) repeat protein